VTNLEEIAGDVDLGALTAYDRDQLRRLTVELAKRRIEPLSLYEPMEWQQNFHQSNSPERIVIGGNRAGKTMATCVEVARAVLGRDKRYPLRDGICYIVGKDGKHNSEILYKKLFKPGAIRIIRDARTGRWRTYQPNSPSDYKRVKETKPAPALIPRRMVAETAWENKKEGLPKMVRLINGWEIHFFSANAKPPQGSAIDLALFDEEIPDKGWYTEIAARLIDKQGKFIWSATPQAGTEQLYDLHERAMKELVNNVQPRTIEEFFGLIDQNQFMRPETVQEFINKLSEEERRVRVGGEFAFTSSKVFPEYRPHVHEVPWFQIPGDWTRYAAIDPGVQTCAVLFLAIPDPRHGDYAYLYDEIYIRNCNAEQFGEAMRHHCGGQNFHKFLIDSHECIKHEHSGKTVGEMYSEALRKRGIKSHVTKSGFEMGSDTPRADAEACRLWLIDREKLGPKLRVLRGRCPNFGVEAQHWRKKRINGVVTDEPESRGDCHLMATFRYLVQAKPVYVKHEAPPPIGKIYAAFKSMEKKEPGQLMLTGG
jgi:hypothetical protein